MTSTFYPPYHIGGDAVHVKYLAEELAKRGHEVHVLHSLDAYSVKRRQIPRQAESKGVFTHPMGTPFSLSAYEAYVFGGASPVTRRFHTLVKETKPEIVHHHNVSLLGYKILRKRSSYLNLYTAHDYWLICPQSNLLRRGNRICEKASCIFCGLAYKKPPQLWRYHTGFKEAIEDIDILIAPSNYLKAKITHELPIEAVTIPNFVPTPPNRIAPSEFSNYLIYVGALEEHKGILLLLEAYKELANYTGLKLAIVGDGMLRRKVDRLIHEYALESIVISLGWVDRSLLYALLRDATGLVIPSVCPDNAPLVSLEALSVGTSVVGSDRGGLPEILSTLDRELVFSWEHNGDLRRAVGFLLENYENLAKKAYKAYRENFSAEAYLTSYAKLLSTHLHHETSQCRKPNEPDK